VYSRRSEAIGDLARLLNDVIKHLLGQPSCKGVLLARVERTHESRVHVRHWNHNAVAKRWPWRDVEMSARRLVAKGPKTYDNGTICQQRKLTI
jgi:hypothetical protein